MIFLVLLLTIGAYKLLDWHFKPQHDQWFFRLGDHVSSILAATPRVAMLVTLLAPLFLVAVILAATQDWLFGFVGVLLHVVILSYALGRVNLFKQLQDYLYHWRSGDYQSAYLHAQQEFKGELGFTAEDTSSLHVTSCKGLLYQWFEQVFVVVFWYLLAGPLAALFMRLLSLYERRYKKDDYDLRLLHLLEWLPVRLLALTYAIAGNFSHCFKELVAVMADFKMPTNELLLKTGLAAIGIDENQMSSLDREQQAQQLQTLQQLQVRSLVVCILLVALLAIF